MHLHVSYVVIMESFCFVREKTSRCFKVVQNDGQAAKYINKMELSGSQRLTN